MALSSSRLVCGSSHFSWSSGRITTAWRIFVLWISRKISLGEVVIITVQRVGSPFISHSRAMPANAKRPSPKLISNFFFEPSAWKPEYPNPAFDNMRADDAFWGARLVANFSDDTIRAIVARAQYSEPGAADHIVRTLITRRDKVLRTWLTGINPLTDARLDAAGRLTFGNAAVAAGVASAPTAYHLTWTRFDNTAGKAAGASYERRLSEPSGQAPAEVLDSEFVRVSVRAEHPQYQVWNLSVTFTFRRTGSEWTLVGVDRQTPAQDDH